MIHFEYIFMPKYDVIEILHENVDTEQFREKLRLAVLITPYGPVKPYGSTEYISKKRKKIETDHIYPSFFVIL